MNNRKRLFAVTTKRGGHGGDLTFLGSSIKLEYMGVSSDSSGRGKGLRMVAAQGGRAVVCIR